MQAVVRAQYEAYPYPSRSPNEDRKLVRSLSPLENLEVIRHYGFGGRRDFNEPFRALIAGGGTGDASTMLGWQLRELGSPGEIVYLDLSEASRQIAIGRAKALGLHNITFLRGSLLDLPQMDVGRFDYINCSGVLHHLESPEAGAQALASALTPDGCLGAMVYAELGRTGVYHAQSILRMLASDKPLEQRVPLARRVLDQLPASNWLRRNPNWGGAGRLGDAELVDRFLHSCDRPYRVPEVLALNAAADLRVVDFVPTLLYRPDLYVNDAEINAMVREMPRFERYALAELVCGSLNRHSWFAVRRDNDIAAPSPQDPDGVPSIVGTDGAALAAQIKMAGQISITLDNTTFRWRNTLSPLLDRTLRLIDGHRSLREIHQALGQIDGVDVPWASFLPAFGGLYELYNGAAAMIIERPGA